SKRLRNLPTGTIEITVNKKITLDYFVFVTDLRTARTRELPLVSAVHSVNGDIKSKLTGIDQNYAEMYPTERIDLSFSTTINSGNRAYILKTVGRYETDTTFLAKQNNLAKLNEQPIIPTENKLYDNYPNPFNPSTIIKYSLKDDGKVSLKIFNSLGEEVRTLVNEIKPSGNYEVEFNASDLSSGIYFYLMQADNFVSSKKMIVIK
ncbi:MAG: T9SS type A sorting domain-containing protein, partial [Ignavibacterium album]|nr:T9SS type A sorting domain-containing protein [Ignavibacterium album]